jgi:molybdenum-dependent DNA-binding transcriptional regulator ModE
MELMHPKAIRVMKLLEGIDKTHSLNSGHKGVCAWSCAWTTLNEFEAEYRLKLIIRKGANGSEITPEGYQVLGILQKLYSATEEPQKELKSIATLPASSW